MKYLSYSALKLYESDRAEFYLRYLAERRPPRPPATKQTDLGTSFDARVKQELAERFGVDCPELDCPNPEDGNRVLSAYKVSGAYDDLCDDLRRASVIQFESRLEGGIDGVPVIGYPDLFYLIDAVPYVLDWKVLGYYAKSTRSPTPGYMLCRDGYHGTQSRSHNTQHKRFLPSDWPTRHNATTLENFSRSYADQTGTYAELLGFGGNFIARIDEICGPKERIRVAQHAAKVSPVYQDRLRERYAAAWEDAWPDADKFRQLETADTGFLELTRGRAY